MREQQFSGQVAMVNAAAGAGIGSAVVHALLERGACVMATDMSASRIARLADKLAAHHSPAQFLSAVVDGAQEASVQAAIAQGTVAGNAMLSDASATRLPDQPGLPTPLPSGVMLFAPALAWLAARKVRV